jgi:hypothetical protein
MVAIKKWPKLSGEKVEILKRLFVAGESMNLDNFVEFFTDDAVYQFSNFPVVYGPQGIRAASLAFLQKVEGLHHHIENVWEMEDGSAVCELQTTYVMTARSLRCPAVTSSDLRMTRFRNCSSIWTSRRFTTHRRPKKNA